MSEILVQIPQIDHWASVGDFNMLEDVQDRQGGSSRIISGSQFREWEKLCMSLQLVDLWSVQSFNRIPESLSFSRSDRRLAGVNLSRLDRFYGDVFMWTRGGQLGILPGFSFSDHSPLKLKLIFSSREGLVDLEYLILFFLETIVNIMFKVFGFDISMIWNMIFF